MRDRPLPSPIPLFLKKKEGPSKRIHRFTQELWDRGDMTPCDGPEGKIVVPVAMIAVPAVPILSIETRDITEAPPEGEVVPEQVEVVGVPLKGPLSAMLTIVSGNDVEPKKTLSHAAKKNFKKSEV